MAIAERRAREFANRHRLILDEAKRLFGRYGYEGVSMDQIAQAIEYSKGVLYKHFNSKDELYMALCADELDRLARGFEEANRAGGTARERLIRIGEVYVAECNRDPSWIMGRFQVLDGFRNGDDSGSVRKIMEQCWRADDRALRLVEEVIREGQANGEFLAEVNPKQLALSMWAHSLGFFMLIASKQLEVTAKELDPIATMRKGWDLILDGVSA